jgi:hypothetical protein
LIRQLDVLALDADRARVQVDVTTAKRDGLKTSWPGEPVSFTLALSARRPTSEEPTMRAAHMSIEKALFEGA